MFDLTGRVAIVTGGCGLLGREHCDVLAEAGAHVVCVDLDATACAGAADDLATRHGKAAMGRATDITSAEDVNALVDEVVARFGRVDILVNNAAMTAKGGTSADAARYFAPFEDYPLDLWDQALRVNLTGTFLCSQAVGRHFVKANQGVIVNVSSIYGVVGPDQRLYEGVPSPYDGLRAFNTPASYSTTKSGVLGFTRYLAAYWRGTKIRVNALTPGGVREEHGERFLSNYAARAPLGRMAERTEYRGAVLFLASDASSYMTGANLVVDGGWTAW